MSSSEMTISNPTFHDTDGYYLYYKDNDHRAHKFPFETMMNLLNMKAIRFYETRYIGGAVHYFKVND